MVVVSSRQWVQKQKDLSKGLKREARNWQQWGVKKAQRPRSEGQYGHQHWLYMLKGTGSEKVHCYGVYFDTSNATMQK